MLTNKKIVYLGVSLFSAMILTSLPTQIVKADTVTSPTNTSATASTSNSTASSSTTSTTPAVTAPTSAGTTPSSTSTTPTPSVTAASISTTSTTKTTPVVTTPVASTAQVSTTGTTSTTPATAPVSTASTTNTTAQSTGSSTASTTGTSSSSSSGGVYLSGSSIPSTTPTPTNTTGTTSVAPNPTISYAIPSDVTDATVVNFTDPTLAGIVKSGLGLKPTDNITVGDIKNYTQAVTLQVNEPLAMQFKPGADGQYPVIESLNGIQYLKFLPSDMIDLDVRLGSDANANTDLTPLDGLQFNNLNLVGNFSDPTKKEISASQIIKLNAPEYGGIELSGDSNYNGIDNAELKTLAPWIINYSNNGKQYDSILLNGNSITDYSPLKGINETQDFNINDNGGTYDPTPIYAVKGQPITFTSTPVTGVDGEDLAGGYHYSTTVPAAQNKIYDLKNLGNDKYELDGADETATVLTYGDAGLNPSNNPTGSLDGITYKYYGTDPFLNVLMHAQPLIWQDHPNVTIKYLDSTGQPILSNGQPYTKTVDGNLIGDSFDLTPDSTVAGYTLTSPATLLKGTYTQDPQVIDLVYSANPTPPTSSSSNSSSSSSSSTVTTPVQTPNVTPKNRVPAKIYDISGSMTDKDAALVDMGVKGTTTINGKTFYLVGYNQLVAADSYNITKSATPGIARTFNTDTQLVNSYGDPISSGFAPNTAVKYSRVVTINGADYYQVATDEFLPATSSVDFIPTTAPTTVSVSTASELYNSQGQRLGTSLPKGSKWATDGCAIINGVKMYRVASDEWISSDVADAYQPVVTTYRTTSATTVYDKTGNVLARILPAGTSWKVDRIVTINGQKYYRVATNEYIKDNG